jgi:outer membrane protein OmpA-like peptidoglycan-associated protein
MNKAINSEGNESSVTYSTDRSRFYFYRKGKLWMSENLGEPTEVEVPTGSFGSFEIVELTINRAENTLFATCDKSNGNGGMDLYMSKKDSEGKWGSFEALTSINTSYDEGSPFLSEDGTKLYFASKGYNSMGDYDIFVATLQGDTFGNVKNMGVPVNSPANDIHFRLTGGNEEFGYLASDRMGGSGDYDVWRFWTCFDVKQTNINGLFAAKGMGFDSATLNLLDLDSNVVATANVLENGGNYSFPVMTEKPYILSLSVNGLKPHTFNLNIPDQCSEYDLYQTLVGELKMDGDSFIFEQRTTLTNAFYDIDGARGDQSREAFVANLNPDVPYYTDPESRVTPFEKDEMIADLGATPIVNADGKEVYEINFDFDKASVNDEGKAMLANLAKALKANPKMSVVIVGHTDSSGPAYYNKKLSLRRAKSVAKILKDNGVTAEQISTDGAGESQLKVKDSNSQGQMIIAKAKQNRRVEIEIK